MDVFVSISTENPVYRFANIGIEVNRVHDIHIFMQFGNFSQGMADVFKTGPKILPTVPGNKDEPFILAEKEELLFHLRFKLQICFNLARYGKQSIDYAITGNMNHIFSNTFI